MSYGPLKNCCRCNALLDLNDPGNGGYCGGDFCYGDPIPKPMSKDIRGPNRKERRAAAKRARKKSHKVGVR